MVNRTLMHRTAALGFFVVAGAAPSCAAPPAPGEVMMVVETDMSLPKDVDTVKIEVLVRGDVRHSATFTKLGGQDSVKIPASLGIIIGEESDPTTPVTVKVTAKQNETPRVLSEAVTTVPESRIAALRMPIQWLCWDQVQVDGNGDAQTTCPVGKTCVAGSCVDKKIDSSKLEDFRREDVFGGGTGTGDGSCFDVGNCFVGSTDAPVNLSDCTIASSDDVNVGIRVDTAGICGPSGCFVVLDGKSDSGWQPAGSGRLKLPTAVCDRIGSGKASGVSVSKVSASCAQKTKALPTCGPWSSAGTAGPTPGTQTPVTLVANQDHPVSLAVADGQVYWVNAGTSDAAKGALKRMPVTGGSTSLLQAGLAFPKGLTLVPDAQGNVGQIYWATSGVGSAGAVLGLDVSKSPAKPITVSIPGLSSPEGIANAIGNIYFTDFSGNAVWQWNIGGNVSNLIAGPGNGAAQIGAYRIAADKKTVYWTNESAMGSVMMADHMDPQPVSIADMQGTPREIALDIVDDEATAVFWTNFSSGEVMTASLTGTPAIAGTPKALFTMATSVNPNGIVVDGTDVYWTNFGDGTVMKIAKAGGEAKVVASGQASPGAIAVDKDNIYWINQGSLAKADGSIMKLKK